MRTKFFAALCATFVAPQVIAEAIDASAFGILSSADIVIAGELHDNRTHHDNQAAIAAAIAPKALVFEMLTSEQAAKGQVAPRDDMAALETALDWTSGWANFDMYFPIFEAAPTAALYGAAVPRDDVRASVSEGAAALFNDTAYGLEVPLPATEQAVREAHQMEAHCNALPEEMLGGMVEAQRLRDASFAKIALQAFRETGGPVLVITGNGHARTDWGMPRFLARAAPKASVISVGQLTSDLDEKPYDRWIITGDYTPRNGDPCAAFKTSN